MPVFMLQYDYPKGKNYFSVGESSHFGFPLSALPQARTIFSHMGSPPFDLTGSMGLRRTPK